MKASGSTISLTATLMCNISTIYMVDLDRHSHSYSLDCSP